MAAMRVYRRGKRAVKGDVHMDELLAVIGLTAGVVAVVAQVLENLKLTFKGDEHVHKTK